VPACNAAAVVPLITDRHSMQKYILVSMSLECFNLVIISKGQGIRIQILLPASVVNYSSTFWEKPTIWYGTVHII